MKKKLFFGLFGFGALLCGSLVSISELKTVKAEGTVNVKVYDYSIVALKNSSTDDNFRFALADNDLENNSDTSYRYFSNDGVKITHEGVTTTHPGLITKEAKNQYCLEMASSWAWDTATYGGAYQFLEGDTIELSGSFARRDGNGDSLEFTTPRKDNATANLSFKRTSVGYENLGGENNITITKDDIWFDANISSGNYFYFCAPRSVLGGGDYDGDNRYVNSTSLTVYNPDGTEAYNGKALVSKQYNFIGEPNGDHGKWERIYLQVDAWAGQAQVQVGGKLKIEGTLTSSANPVQSITFSDFEFVRTGDNTYYASEETQVVKISNDNLINLDIRESSDKTYSLIDFKLANDNYSLKVDGNWGEYYNIQDAVTITHADGTTTTKDANLIITARGKYELLFYDGGWMGNQYHFVQGDSFKIVGSVTTTRAGSYITTFEFDYEYNPPEDVEISLNSSTIESMELIKKIDSTEAMGYYFTLDIYVNFEDNLEKENSWSSDKMDLPNAVTVTSKDGTVTTLRAILFKEEGNRYMLLFYDGTQYNHWVDNAYDFKPGDHIAVNGTYSGSYRGSGVTVHYDFEYQIHDEVVINLEYTEWTLNARRPVQYDKTDGEPDPRRKGIYFYLNVKFAENDDAPKGPTGAGSFRGKNDVTIIRKNGESFKVNSLITEFKTETEEKLEIGLSYWSCDLSTQWDFEDGDKIVFDTNSQISVNDQVANLTKTYVINFKGTFYYAKQFEAIAPGPIVLEEEYEDVLAVESKINSIGEISYPDSLNAINEASEAYEALEPAPKSLVSNYDVLVAAKAEYQDKENTFKVNDVENKINAIGTVTADSGDVINAARSAYDALNSELQNRVSNYDTLTTAEATYQDIKDHAAAANVDALIEAIGTVDSSTECERRIAEARAAYEALTSTQASYVTKLATLEAAEAQIEVERNKAAAQPAIDAINAIGTVDSSSASLQRIQNAFNIYNSIGRDAQPYVTNYDVLLAAQQSFEEALQLSKQAAISDIQAYYDSLNMNKYSEDNQKVIADLLEEAKAAINSQTSSDNLRNIVDSYIEQMSAVKTKPSASKKGCGGSVIATSVVLSSLALAGLGLLSIKKRKED